MEIWDRFSRLPLSDDEKGQIYSQISDLGQEKLQVLIPSFLSDQAVAASLRKKFIVAPGAGGTLFGPDFTFKTRDEMSVPVRPVPDIHCLQAFVREAPAVRFAVAPQRFLRLPDENRDKIFRVAEPGENCMNIVKYVDALVEPPAAGGSEDNFHHLWDTLISDVLAFFYVGETWWKERNKSGEGTSGILRPDVVASFARIYALFRGEEKGPEGKGKPEDEVVDKMDWTYGTSVPYILGYYAREYRVTLCAMTNKNDQNVRVDIEQFDLTRAKDRVGLFIACMNMARILCTLKDLCVSQNVESDIVKFERLTKTVDIYGQKVCKTYFTASKFQAVLSICSELKECPNVEVLLHYNQDEWSLVFTRGMWTLKPTSLKQLMDCLRCICEALVWLHGHGWMHRDIRWENVVRAKDDSTRWLLVDFDEAARIPSQCACRLNPSTHAPEMMIGLHDEKVDIWGLGHLLGACNIQLPRELKRLMQQCLAHDPSMRPTAQAVLDHLNAL